MTGFVLCSLSLSSLRFFPFATAAQPPLYTEILDSARVILHFHPLNLPILLLSLWLPKFIFYPFHFLSLDLSFFFFLNTIDRLGVKGVLTHTTKVSWGSNLRLLVCKLRPFFTILDPLISLDLSKVHVIDEQIRCSSLTPSQKKKKTSNSFKSSILVVKCIVLGQIMKWRFEFEGIKCTNLHNCNHKNLIRHEKVDCRVC